MVGDTPSPEAALERFVVENDDLLELEARIGRFNIFDALGIARAEIRHSNFLRFLLDPNESHGQGDVFLRAVLMDLLKVAPAQLRPLSPIEVDGAELRGVEVFRERDRIDLEIVCREPRFVIAIENKVDSGEHGDQLARYRGSIRRRHGDSPTMFVFLTPGGDDASEPSWVPYSYQQLHHTLSRVRASNHNSIGDDVLAFLDHYLNLIGTRFMNDAKIDELCERIFRNHRQAIELIYDRVGRPGSGPLACVEATVRSDPRWHVFYRSGTVVDFVPRDFGAWLPKIGLDRKTEPQSWFIIRFEVYRNHLYHYAEVRRIGDLERRRRIIDALLKEPTAIGFKKPQASKVKDEYTRVCGKTRLLEWSDENAPDDDAVAAAVMAKLNQLAPFMPQLAERLKSAMIA